MARKSFLLRINPELWDEINGWANDELRSVNSQMEFILRQAVQHRKRSGERDADSKDGDKEPEGQRKKTE